jgi:hypothetical protein
MGADAVRGAAEGPYRGHRGRRRSLLRPPRAATGALGPSIPTSRPAHAAPRARCSRVRHARPGRDGAVAAPTRSLPPDACAHCSGAGVIQLSSAPPSAPPEAAVPGKRRLPVMFPGVWPRWRMPRPICAAASVIGGCQGACADSTATTAARLGDKMAPRLPLAAHSRSLLPDAGPPATFAGVTPLPLPLYAACVKAMYPPLRADLPHTHPVTSAPPPAAGSISFGVTLVARVLHRCIPHSSPTICAHKKTIGLAHTSSVPQNAARH